MKDKESARLNIQALVEQFRHNYALYTQPHSDYNETQLRSDFSNRLLLALGWDVYNEKQAPQHLREVVQEEPATEPKPKQKPKVEKEPAKGKFHGMTGKEIKEKIKRNWRELQW